jgi:hypothetical protein
MELAGWEVPLFSSDLEPRGAYFSRRFAHLMDHSLMCLWPELKRLRCGVCSDAWAEVQCHRCNQQYCAGCETHAHSAVSDPAAHQDESEPCNGMPI